MKRAVFERGDLALFLALADSGSLAEAARVVGVHHATAYRRLEDLEARAGARLFDRLAGGYVLTKAGAALIHAAREVQGRVLEFDALVLNYDRALSGEVRVTTSDGLAADLLPRHIAGFRARFPGIHVELLVANRLLDLADRDVDVAVRPARKLTGSMVGRKVAAMNYTLYASPAYVRQHSRLDPVKPDFAGHAVIHYHESLNHFSTAKWLERHARKGRVAARCDSLWAMLALARAGAGIAAIPCVIGDPDPGVVRLMAPPAAMSTHLWLLTHPAIRKVARVRALLDYLWESLAGDRALLAGAATTRK